VLCERALAFHDCSGERVPHGLPQIAAIFRRASPKSPDLLVVTEIPSVFGPLKTARLGSRTDPWRHRDSVGTMRWPIAEDGGLD
jgi:hypothetical protein